MVVNPITMTPDQTLAEALELMATHRISGIPIVEKSGRLCGILTNRDVRFAENPRQPVSELMTKENLATVPIGTTEAEARRILHQRRIEKLIVVDEGNHCVGLITVKDIEKVGRCAVRDQGRRGAAAGRGGDHRRRRRLRPLGGADRRRLRLHRHRHRPRPQYRRGEGRGASEAGLQLGPGDRRQRRDRRRRAGAGRCGRRCDQGRHRTWLDLHDAHCRGRRSSAADGGDGGGERGERAFR